MAKNRGKDLEKNIEESLRLVDNSFIDRLYDTTNGYKNIKQPADFIFYHEPYLYYIECKSTTGNTFGLDRLTQYDKLCERDAVPGIHGIVILWFIDHKKTYWVPVSYFTKCYNDGAKSINIKTLEEKFGVREIFAKYPRINGVYDMPKFIGLNESCLMYANLMGGIHENR